MSQDSSVSAPEQARQDEGHQRHLHIFVNRRKFDEANGVEKEMTGAQIAALVEVPADNAVVRWDSGPSKGKEIPVTETVKIKNGDHFLVTRRVVEGGNGHRTH